MLFVGLALAAACGLAAEPPRGPEQRLLLAFATTRDRRAPPYPVIHFYEHDGVANGRIVGSIPTVGGGTNTTRADMHPSLTRDGRYCAFSAQFGVRDGARLEVWDRKENKLLTRPALNDESKIHRMHPSLSGDGRRAAFTAYGWAGVGPRWDVLVWDFAAGQRLQVPGLNHERSDERMPTLSGDGRLVAYTSNASGGAGGLDIYLYDVDSKKPVALPGLNSPYSDIEPALSADGQLIAFTSDRPGGGGGRDIYLYDRAAEKFMPLPGLNSGVHDQSPSLSPDGRFLAFVSERLAGAGERDIYLYDRKVGRLLPTPGLNSKEDDFDPCLTVLGAASVP
jgi:Tol biopolymer transport system component